MVTVKELPEAPADGKPRNNRHTAAHTRASPRLRISCRLVREPPTFWQKQVPAKVLNSSLTPFQNRGRGPARHSFRRLVSLSESAPNRKWFQEPNASAGLFFPASDLLFPLLLLLLPPRRSLLYIPSPERPLGSWHTSHLFSWPAERRTLPFCTSHGRSDLPERVPPLRRSGRWALAFVSLKILSGVVWSIMSSLVPLLDHWSGTAPSKAARTVRSSQRQREFGVVHFGLNVNVDLKKIF